jgi:hypothetical protein
MAHYAKDVENNIQIWISSSPRKTAEGLPGRDLNSG